MALSGKGVCNSSSLPALIEPRVTKIQPSGPMNCTPFGVFLPSPTTLRSVTVLSSTIVMVTPLLELADTAVANQFAREAEIAVAALLAADLHDPFVFAHGSHEALAFVDG